MFTQAFKFKFKFLDKTFIKLNIQKCRTEEAIKAEEITEVEAVVTTEEGAVDITVEVEEVGNKRKDGATMVVGEEVGEAVVEAVTTAEEAINLADMEEATSTEEVNMEDLEVVVRELIITEKHTIMKCSQNKTMDKEETQESQDANLRLEKSLI